MDQRRARPGRTTRPASAGPGGARQPVVASARPMSAGPGGKRRPPAVPAAAREGGGITAASTVAARILAAGAVAGGCRRQHPLHPVGIGAAPTADGGDEGAGAAEGERGGDRAVPLPAGSPVGLMLLGGSSSCKRRPMNQRVQLSSKWKQPASTRPASGKKKKPAGAAKDSTAAHAI